MLASCKLSHPIFFVSLKGAKLNPYPETHYFIQINNTGSDLLSKILKIPPSIVTVRDAIKRYGQKEWRSMLSFALTRNPYDRAVSLYGDYYYANKFKMLEKNISFLNFLNLTLKHQKKPYYDKPRLFQSQWEWLQNFEGELGVRDLGTYENFDTHVFTYLSMLGHDPFEHTIKPMREANPYRWQKYYEGTEGRIAAGLIRDFWCEDFDNLNYEG